MENAAWVLAKQHRTKLLYVQFALVHLFRFFVFPLVFFFFFFLIKKNKKKTIFVYIHSHIYIYIFIYIYMYTYRLVTCCFLFLFLFIRGLDDTSQASTSFDGTRMKVPKPGISICFGEL